MRIADTVSVARKSIEGNLYDVVGTYQQIEDKFVERFLEEK